MHDLISLLMSIGITTLAQNLCRTSKPEISITINLQ